MTTQERIQLYEALQQLIRFYQPKASSEHLLNTPRRYLRMLDELCCKEEFSFTTFPATRQEIISIRDIPFYSLCAHHLIPYFGKAHIYYEPKKRIAGLSKIVRVVENESRGFTVQEEVTEKIANFLEARLEPLGVLVILKARHLCIEMRGVKKSDSSTITYATRGNFGKMKKAEILSLL